MASDRVTPGVFVGVDSGGTRTNVQIAEFPSDGAAPIESSYEVSESLSGALPVNLIPMALRKVLAPLEKRIGGPDPDALPVHVWISAAGFTQWTRGSYVVALNEVAPSILGSRIRCVGAANDAVSLLLGSRANGIVIAGTGSNVIVRPEGGDLYQAGGHEWVACDYGSGFWIGLRAIRQAYRDFEDGHDSALLQRMRQLYGVEPDDDGGLIETLRDLAVGDKDMKKEIAKLAAGVCAAAERGDQGAQNIVKLEAEDLADVTAGALRRRFPRSQLAGRIRFVQCGSLLANPFYRTSFEAQLEMRLLSGSECRTQFDWHRVVTGGDAAVQLAQDLAAGADPYLELELPFRPAIVHI